MRKHDKKKRNMQILIGLFIVFLMTTSVLSMWGSDDTNESIEFEGHEFTKVESGWLTYLGDNPVVMINNPLNLTSVPVNGLDNLKSNGYTKVYFSVKPGLDYNYALYSINSYLNMPSVKNMACYEDGPGCEDYPLKDCKDAGDGILVIKFEGEDPSAVEFSDDCLTIKGEDLNMAVDKLVLELLFG